MRSHTATGIVAAATVQTASAQSATQKVVELLQNMKATATSERNAEQLEAATFATRCGTTKDRLMGEIADLMDNIAEEDAAEGKAAASSADLQSEIEQLDYQLTMDKADVLGATKVRAAEKEDFQKTHMDYSESIDALNRAIAMVSSNSVSHKAVVALQTSFLQTSSRTAKMVALAQFLAEAAQPAQGAKSGYQSAMGPIITMLEELESKFTAEMNDLNKAEMESQHAFEKLVDGLVRKQEMDAASKDRKAKKKGAAEAAGKAASAAKAEFQADKRATTGSLNESKTSCAINIALYVDQDKLREEEQTALGEAISILSADNVSGASARHLGLVTKEAAVSQAAVSFLQMHKRSSDPVHDAAIDKASYILAQAGENEPILASLATRIRASPFTKVLRMVHQLVSKLQKEAVADAEKHGWCTARIGESKMDMEHKTEELDEVAANVEKLEAVQFEVSEKVATLGKEIAFLQQDRAAATETRAANKAENEHAIKEATEAQAAVANAIVVLQEFYSGAAAAGASAAEAGSSVVSTYSGGQSEGSGVLDILQVIESDFARVEAERNEAEATQSSGYKKLMNSSEVDVEVKKTQKAHNEQVLADTKKELQAAIAEKAEVADQLKAATASLASYKLQCESTPTFEEQQARKKSTIQSLKEALEVLQNSGV